jgi:photosystem II stability/assembly factor-like uncharacterized protein
MRRVPYLGVLAVLLILAALAAAALVAASGQGGWQTSYAPGKGPNYSSSDIRMLASGTGILCGAVDIDDEPTPLAPTMYRTTDGGVTWTKAPVPEIYGQLSGVGFSDDQHAWAVGGDYSKNSQGALLLSSADAGKTWTRQAITATSALEQVQFVGLSTGYVTGDDGAVYSTTDGGSHWTRTAVGAADVSFTGMSFVDATHGWVCGPQGNEDFYGGRCYVTADGGHTWKDVTPDKDVVVTDCSFVSTTEGWVIGDDRTLFHTTDGGTTWSKERLDMVPGAELRRLDFVDAEHGWLIGNCFPGGQTYDMWGVVLHTTDGGDSWVQQDSGVGELSSEVWATDESHVWAAYQYGLVLRSSDGGGAGITPAGSPTTAALNAVSVKSGGRATFRFLVTDPGVPRAQVKIQILDAKKHVKASIGAGWRAPGETFTFSAKVKLRAGTYTWRAACVDYTGDPQASATVKQLIVK